MDDTALLTELMDGVDALLDRLETINQGFDYEAAYKAGCQFKYALENALEVAEGADCSASSEAPTDDWNPFEEDAVERGAYDRAVGRTLYELGWPLGDGLNENQRRGWQQARRLDRPDDHPAGW